MRYLDFIIYWCIVFIPFSFAISPVPTNVFSLWAIGLFLIKRLIKKERFFPKADILIPLLALILITVLSFVHSVDFKDSFKGGLLRLLHFILLFFVVSREIKDKRHIYKIAVSVAAGIIFVVADSVWQVVMLKDFVRGYPPVFNIGFVRATASFKDSNLLGIYLSAISPLIFGLNLYYFKGRAKRALAIVSLAALLGIELTYSRPTLLAIYIILLFFGIVRKDKLLVTLLLLLALLSPLIAPKPVKIWAKEVGYNPLRFMCNDDRIAAYRNSLRMIADHPFIGVGANTYMKNYKKYKEPVEYRGVYTPDHMYAHNMYLQMAAEIGLIGLSIFFWFLYRLFAHVWRIYKSLTDTYLKVVSLSLCACLIAFLVNGLTESSLYYSRLAGVFWYMAGLALSLEKLKDV